MLITYFTIVSFLLMELFLKMHLLISYNCEKKTQKTLQTIKQKFLRCLDAWWCPVQYQKKIKSKKIMQIQQHKIYFKIYLIYISLIVVNKNFNYLIEVFEQKLFIDGISSLDHGPACLLQWRQNIIPLTSLQLCSLRTWSL